MAFQGGKQVVESIHLYVRQPDRLPGSSEAASHAEYLPWPDNKSCGIKTRFLASFDTKSNTKAIKHYNFLQLNQTWTFSCIKYNM